MNIHNIYCHGEISKIPKLTLTFNTYHAMDRFSRRQTGNFFPRSDMSCKFSPTKGDNLHEV